MVNGSTDAANMDRSTASVMRVDESSWTAPGDVADHAIQMMGFFIPVYSGPYKFCVKAASTAKVYFSDDDNPDNKVLFVFYCHSDH